MGTILRAFDIKYMSRTAIKGQVLTDLVAEFTKHPEAGITKEVESKGMQVIVVAIHECPSWKLYVDKAANQKGSKVGIVIVSPNRITIEKSLRLGFSSTNNKAKYEALLAGVAMVKKLGEKVVKVFLNSRLVIGQIKGELEAKDHRMQGYLGKARQLQSGFETFFIQQVPSSKNAHADSLATLATSFGQALPRVILVKDFFMPAKVELMRIGVHQIRVGPS